VDFDKLIEDAPPAAANPQAQPARAPVSFDQLQDDSERYGGTTGMLKAFGLGAARSGSFGISDEFLVHSGAMKPEDIKGYREENPYSSGAGEVAGVLGAALAPEAGVLGALSAPVKGVARAGGAVAEAVAPAATSTVGKILSQAAATGAGSAVEGAAYGLGQVVSEHALGDPDLNGEKVLATVGTSALVGGALGSLFGGAKGAIQAKFPKFLSEKTIEGVKAGNFESMVEASDLPEAEKKGFIEGLTKLKADAGEIKEAAAALDAPVLPGMVSDSQSVQKAQSALLEGAPSFSGLKAQQLAADGFDKAAAATEGALGAELDVTKAGLGDTLKTIVETRVKELNAPINELYDEISAMGQRIPIREKSGPAIARKILKLDELRISPSASESLLAKRVADEIPNLQTVEDVRRYRSMLRRETAAKPELKHMGAILSEKLEALEEKSVIRFAKEEMKTPLARDKMLSFLEKHKIAKSQYAEFRGTLQELGDVIGKKKIYGAQDFLTHLEDMTPERLADRLSGKNNSQFLNWFSKEMPEAMASIAQYQKGLIRNAAMKDGEFNIRRALTEIDKLPKEYQQKIFTPEELQKLAHVKKYVQAFPKNFNPSNTANASAFRHFFEGAIAASASNVRDWAIEQFINAATSSGEKTQAFIDGLSTVEKSALKTSNAIKSGVNEIFSTKDAGSPVKGYLAITSQGRRDDHDGLHRDLSDMSQNPQKLIDHLSAQTEAITAVAPRTSESVQGAVSRATQFLQSKLPGNNVPKKPLSGTYKPSDAEIAKWHKYFSAVEKPTSVLRQVAYGNVVPETMEALQFVYPKLLKEMQGHVADKMTEAVAKKTPIPYRTKLSLSLFLGSDLVNSLEPVNMLSAQNTLATATMEKQQAQMASVNKKSLDKMGGSNRLLTAQQASSRRSTET
jgi:hypothetical protein